jgi:hypothetical protein
MSDRDGLKDEYFFVASDYYVAGRFAFWAKLLGISGILFHHALEMFLKGHLLLTMTPDELKDRFGHNLTKIWRHFKTATGDASLDGSIRRSRRSMRSKPFATPRTSS